jgi:hypothetical protein
MAVSIDVSARTGGAEKELQQFSRVLTGLSKLWENAMGGRGGRQGAQGVQQVSKSVEKLGRDAQRATDNLKRIGQTLEQVAKQRQALEKTGSVFLKDRDQYKLLQDQERSLQRQSRTWQTIAANRAMMAQGAANGAQPPGPGAPGGNSGRGALAGRFASPLQQFAQSVGGGLGGPVVGALIGGGLATALGGMVVHAIRESMESQKEAADFIPRMRPGALAGTDAFGLTRRMRGVGMPFGFNTRESMGVFQSMSEGGSNFGHGLERDARSAMQFGRMFGVDAGGEASQLATAQRTGAFKAGDAKRFAGMLATEIARTGLGPRAQEVQEATLMLLNQQLHTLGTANAGPIMALQTAFNKTGIAGLTGLAGANTISKLQDAVTNPGSEASEALNFSVFRKMGAKSLYDVRYLQEEGLNNRKYLPTLFRTVEQSAPNNEAADIALQQHTNGALSLHMLKMLRQRMGGRLSNFTSGGLKDIERMLGSGGGFLEKGGAGAMEAMPGNQLRKIEAHLHDLMMKFGEPATQKLIEIAGSADKTVSRLEGVLKSSDTSAHKLNAIADVVLRQAGIDPNSPGGKLVKKGASVMGQVGDVIAGEVKKSQEFERTHPGQKRRLGQIAGESLGLGMTQKEKDAQAWDEFAPAGSYVPYEKRRHGKTPPVLPAVKGMFETYDAGGGYQSASGGRHLVITIREGGLVSDASKAALKRYIHECVREGHQETVRSMPNSRNRRH